jgi:hypothetical protein
MRDYGYQRNQQNSFRHGSTKPLIFVGIFQEVAATDQDERGNQQQRGTKADL